MKRTWRVFGFALLLALAAALALTGCGEGKTYQIIFDSNGGSEVAPIETKGGERLYNLPYPKKTGYKFDGWYWDNNTFEVPFLSDSLIDMELNEDKIVYAKWTPNGEDTPDPNTFVSYALKKMVVTSPMGDVTIDLVNMTPEQEAQYGAVIDLYGRSVEISGKQIKFTGSVLSLYNPVSYTLSGATVAIADATVAGTFNAISLASGEFRFGVEGAGGSFAFVYRSASYVSQNTVVTFDYQGAASGNTTKTKEVVYGEAYGELPTPEKTGHDFRGWFTGKDGSGTEITAETECSDRGKITLYAKWEAAHYFIFFDYKGGTGDREFVEVVYGKNVDIAYGSRDGYVFNGWWTLDKNGAEVKLNYDKFGPPYMVTENTYAFAKWTPQKFTVTFRYEGAQSGNTEEIREVYYSEMFGTLPLPVKEGNVFQGWYSAPGGRGKQYTEYDRITLNYERNITLYAKWQATITFDYAGAIEGDNPLSKTVVYRQLVGELPAPTSIGYAFGGWFTEPDGQGKEYTENSPFEADGSLTLYAYWVPETKTTALKIEQVIAAGETAERLNRMDNVSAQIRLRR